MIQLPDSSNVNIAALSAVFADTTNSYKFYWFLAILDSLRDNDNPRMTMQDLSLRMLSSVWYPLDYFKLSFGSRDGFKSIATFVSKHLSVDNSPNAAPVLDQLVALPAVEQVKLQRLIKVLINWVPYRFIRPMFALETRGLPDPQVNALVMTLANSSSQAPYLFEGDCIIVNDSWLQYLQQHQAILRGFIYWHLVKFLQKNNPNVTGLTEKLEKPISRNLTTATRFWKSYMTAHSELTCIYSGQLVTPANLSLDHFLPWSFVAHDQLWNIIPTTKSVNSSKNNCLPCLERYFEPFAQLQFNAFQFHAAKGNGKLLEDYHLIFAQELIAIQKLSYPQFREELHRQVIPRLQTAQNLGFGLFIRK